LRCARQNSVLTGENTTFPADLWLPRTASLVLSAERDELVLQAEGEDLLEIVVRGLGLFGIGESSDGDTIKDGFAVLSLSENESGGAVADCRDGLHCQQSSFPFAIFNSN
jgi:hypothetical protein